MAKIRDIADSYHTLYVMGGLGSPLNRTQAERLIAHDSYNDRADRAAAIQAAVVRGNVWAFDCAGIIKAVLWGWYGNWELGYGGAKYTSNDVPDIGENTMISRCSEISTDFSAMVPGEVVWKEGHIGVYVGGGLAIECTPVWEDGVQYTACNQDVSGYPRRDWPKHGKLPWVDYAPEAAPVPSYDVSGFPDVPNSHWAAQHIGSLTKIGVVTGDGGLYHPDKPATKAEVAAIACRLMEHLLAQMDALGIGATAEPTADPTPETP